MRARLLLALLSSLGALAALPAPVAQGAPAGEAIAPIASHVVVTGRRSLFGLPRKGVVVDPAGWERVTAGLPDPPAAPDFDAGEVAVLVVADTTGASDSEVARLERLEGGGVRAVLVRQEADPRADDLPEVKAFLFTLPDFPGGVELVHRTVLPEGMGTVQRRERALPSDREPRGLPRLGPDLRLALGRVDGGDVPEGIKLRVEVYYARTDLPGRVVEVPFPREGLLFPQLRDGARYIYAAYGAGLRTRNPLVIEELPPVGLGGGAPPIEHRFLLEPVPGSAGDAGR